MLCSSALFVSSFGFIGPEKPHWGIAQSRCLLFIIEAVRWFFIFTDKSLESSPGYPNKTKDYYLQP